MRGRWSSGSPCILSVGDDGKRTKDRDIRAAFGFVLATEE